MRFKRYRWQNPDALAVQMTEVIDWAAVVTAAGFDPADEEVSICQLAEEWNGHAPGALVVTGLTVAGHPFAVES